MGVFRLPLVSLESAEDVGGVWEVYAHPAYRQLRFVAQLPEEAHSRRRPARLHFYTPGNARRHTSFIPTIMELGDLSPSREQIEVQLRPLMVEIAV